LNVAAVTSTTQNWLPVMSLTQERGVSELRRNGRRERAEKLVKNSSVKQTQHFLLMRVANINAAGQQCSVRA